MSVAPALVGIDLPSDLQDGSVLGGFVCPYCSAATTYCDSDTVYNGRSYGMIYLCRPCYAWVGVHKGTRREALGRLANAELREWKKTAHAHFDPLWRMSRRKHSRHRAYSWLARELYLPLERTHIGMFNVEQCQKVVHICQSLVSSLSK